MSRIIFFDIDGTLVGFQGTMRESTRDALQMAKENGHKILICSGRSKCQIYPWLLELGFDGIVAASGAYVECDGKEVFHHLIPEADVKNAIRIFKEQHLIYGFQTRDSMLIDEDNIEPTRKFMIGRGIEPEKVDQLILRNNNGMRLEDSYDKIEKMMYYESRKTVAEMSCLLGADIDVTITSFEEPDESSGEVTAAGIHKALGMQKVLEYYGRKQEDTVAFGDGPNDVEMMQFAKIGVAMGNAVEFLKKDAYMVTDDIDSDGIMHAMQKLGLI